MREMARMRPNAMSDFAGGPMLTGGGGSDTLAGGIGGPVAEGMPAQRPQSSQPQGSGFQVLAGTRADYRPTPGMLNISMDFNAAPSGRARGTEVIIPDDASPEVRAAAERFNQMVADFARRHGIEDYPVRGVRTRSENKRGVPHTVHAEPFFNTDADMQRAIQSNPAEFAQIYREAFGNLGNARLIAPHGVGRDRGATSDVFGDETSFGEMMAQALLEQQNPLAAYASGPPRRGRANPMAAMAG
jgi:hypothetical protein